MTRTAKPRSVSFNDADWKAIRADAARAGLSVSAYLRTLWLAARPREVVAGAWEERADGAYWARVGPVAAAAASATRWSAYDGSRSADGGADGLPANRAAADAWLRSRGVVLA